MSLETESRSVQRDIVIDARPETVWELLVDPTQAVRWMGQMASFDVRPGGHYRVEVIPNNVASGRFVEIDPPRRLVFTWLWDDQPVRQLIEIDFEEHDGVTTVRFTHRDLWDEEAVRSHEDGWGRAFDNLDRALATAA